ncbi:MAG: 50S ribosomal protein L15 [Candidatus Saganbacteria bacterium]|nr:50S ribosomal protein L15 [Candidatus Saganbacteria bacterium]
MKLNELKPARGARHKKKRVARGTGSGRGKTAGRGHKGQKSRSGGTKGIRFEGGQTPLYRRLPKRGFKNYPFKKEYAIFNLGQLDKIPAQPAGLVKVLGGGELKEAKTVSAHKFSASARKKIEAAGGKCVVLGQAAPAGEGKG